MIFNENGSPTDEQWEQLIKEAVDIKWIMFKVEAQPCKSDVENVLMKRHDIDDRYWPHQVMNHLESSDILGSSFRSAEWKLARPEPTMTSDILAYIKEKVAGKPSLKRWLKIDIGETT